MASRALLEVVKMKFCAVRRMKEDFALVWLCMHICIFVMYIYMSCTVCIIIHTCIYKIYNMHFY